MLSRQLEHPSGRRNQGFTLVELMITLIVLSLVVLGLTMILYATANNKISVGNRLEATQQARVAMQMMAHDIRSAGYNADEVTDPVNPQPSVAYVDSLQILINSDLSGPVDTLSYDPNGNPKPKPLQGTPWSPALKYRTGAELTRWTLDVNNDGVVDASDQTAVDGADAARTPNPNDYVLVRQVYGDSLNNVAGDNGGATEHVALVLKPGGTVAPLFTVYMKGSTTPYDWSNGPVPAAQLANIQRVVVRVTAGSARADKKGQFATTTLETDVNSLRNSPDFGSTEYAVSGYVFNDLNSNHQKDAGEPGIPGATVFLGTLSGYTDANGRYTLRAPVGTYKLKHLPASGYSDFAVPDSFSVNLTAPVSHDFADIVAPGAMVKCVAYNDLNANGVLDVSETMMKSVRMDMSPGSLTGFTNSSGYVQLFAPVGSYTVTCTAPDSFAVTSANPVSRTMSNGVPDSIYFGLTNALTGTIQGTVYRDLNRNGSLNNGEPGIQNVWVGVSPDGGLTVAGYAYTDASGNFAITCPINDPPHTKPYSVMVVPPNGYFPTTSTSIGSVWLQNGQTISNQTFGMAAFQVISLNASRVLSLASADLIEKDWNGNQTSRAHGDADLVLGADASGADNISVWFNQYNSTPLFNDATDYTRLAPQSVLSMTLDTLDTNGNKSRPDLVTGTRYTSPGNFFVWYCQDNPNEGWFPSSYSTGQAYRTSDLGDVQSIVTLDCAGNTSPDAPDIIVGTKSTIAGQGTIEVWASNNAATPSYSRVEIYPPAGAIPSNTLGEVTSMALADLDGDGRKDLVVGTHTGNYNGQVLVFKNVSKVTGARFVYQCGFTLNNDAIDALALTDIDGDGLTDIVVGTQTGVNSGHLTWYQNTTLYSMMSFNWKRTVNTPGIVTSLVAADMGGSSRGDLVVGYRSDASSYAGGVRIYFTDSGNIPNSSTDPSSGTLTNFVPAITANNFNYGVYPSTPAPPFLMDFAAGVKITATTGALVLFIR